jgi:ATP-dependent exoDNAse (exonuclease V) beta subunit
MSKNVPFKVYNASAGSGKTFTLVRDILVILFTHTDPFYFKHILAITFTNKASAEMKERILHNLTCFSQGKINDLGKAVQKEARLDEDTFFNRSKNILEAILTDYSHFHITTIDSFTHTIIRTFAYEFELTGDFEVELNTDKILQEAVDSVLAQLGGNPELTEQIIKFSLLKSEDDKSWDIRHTLYDYAKILLNESHKRIFNSISHVPFSTYHLLEKKFRKNRKKLKGQLYDIGSEVLNSISHAGLEHSDFTSKRLPNFFINLIENPDKSDFTETTTLSKNIAEEKFYNANTKQGVIERIESVLPDILSLYNQAKKIHENYMLYDFFIESMTPLSVLGTIYSELELLKEQYNIRFISDFNELIYQKIKDEPAPFIYERLGTFFKHFFIDEMQDTSTLQWENLKVLIDNTLNQEGGSLMLVGDAKQSIYRWRGSKPEQFMDLSNPDIKSPFQVEKKVIALDTNYRSFTEIINFNNLFFRHISHFLNVPKHEQMYASEIFQNHNTKIGGYVSIDFLDPKTSENKGTFYPEKIYEKLQEIETQYSLGEICILVRDNKKAVEIADFLSQKEIAIRSSDSLLLVNNEKINFLVNILQYLLEPQREDLKMQICYFLYHHISLDIDLHSFLIESRQISIEGLSQFLKKLHIDFKLEKFRQKQLYASVEYIIRSFNIISKPNSFIQTFLEFILDYEQQYGSDLKGFLSSWDEQKNNLSISSEAQENAVQIMTVHKSKGLQFPVVIFPYNVKVDEIKKGEKVWYEFDAQETEELTHTLINLKKDLTKTTEKGKLLYHSKINQKELDNYNILYVALTRAEEQLYILTDTGFDSKNQAKTNYYSGLFIHFLQEMKQWQDGVTQYHFGNRKRKKVDTIQDNCNKEKITSIQAKQYISHDVTDDKLVFHTTQSSLWDTEQEKAISWGNLLHELLAHIHTIDDLDRIIYTFYQNGLIPENMLSQVKQSLKSVAQHSQLQSFFKQENKFIAEREIYDIQTQKTYIPDRIVYFSEKEVGLLDYKTGQADDSHHTQVKSYAQLLENMGLQVIKKYLVYLSETGIEVQPVS